MSDIIAIGVILGCVSIFGIICVCCDKQCRYKNCAENINNTKTEETKTEETKKRRNKNRKHNYNY